MVGCASFNWFDPFSLCDAVGVQVVGFFKLSKVLVEGWSECERYKLYEDGMTWRFDHGHKVEGFQECILDVETNEPSQSRHVIHF